MERRERVDGVIEQLVPLLNADMTKTGLLLTISILVVLGTMPIAAAEATQPANVDAQTGASDKDKHTGTAECPIKKTIDGKTYCFQNDPALTKRQGGG